MKTFTTSKTAAEFISNWLGKHAINKINEDLFEIKKGLSKKLKSKKIIRKFAYDILTQMLREGINIKKDESLLFGIKEKNDPISWL